MTVPGVFHVLLMAVALAIGAGLFSSAKGTPWHRRWGWGFVLAVLASDLLVFTLHQDSATFGVFHGLALVSFASVLAALALARRSRSRRSAGPGLRIAHGHVMLWSFGGMVAAGLGQGATVLGVSPWPAIVATLLGVGGLAARLDFHAMLAVR